MRIGAAKVERTFEPKAGQVAALRGVTLSIGSGEFVAITGRSGSGKTTLLNIIGGLDRPTAGSISLGDVDLGSLSPKALAQFRRRNLGYVFQDLNLIPSLTSVENVALPLELDGVSRRRANSRARHSLEAVLGQRGLDRYPDELSGGEQQRVAIARALCGDRSLLLADEPTGALDDLTAESTMALLRDRARDGATVVVVTHDSGLAGWADRMVHLADGRIAAESSRTGVA